MQLHKAWMCSILRKDVGHIPVVDYQFIELKILMVGKDTLSLSAHNVTTLWVKDLGPFPHQGAHRECLRLEITELQLGLKSGKGSVKHIFGSHANDKKILNPIVLDLSLYL